MSDKEKIYAPQEERLNIITHAVGIVAAVVVGAFFICKVVANNGDAVDLMSMILYVVGMLGSFVCSTAYHSAKPGTALRRNLRKFDHSAIYWYIAGCYSPVTLMAMRDVGYWGWGIFTFCWLCAIVGTVVCFFGQKKQNYIETACYVLMGLTIVVAMKQFYEAVPFSAFMWVIGEGVAYITGAVLYSLHRLKYVHAIFHFFVLVGTVCHMIAVWKIIGLM